MGYSRQKYWSGLPFRSPMDHILSELSTTTHLSWVAHHGMAHSFIELDKPSVHSISSVQSLSCVWLFATPWTTACQASLFITNSQSLSKLMSIKSMMPSNHLILCRPLLLLHSIFPTISIFSNESALRIRWPKYWSFSFNISPSNEHSICHKVWKTQWPQAWKRSVFITIPKKANSKECCNYCTIELISQPSKAMPQILQARL